MKLIEIDDKLVFDGYVWKGKPQQSSQIVSSAGIKRQQAKHAAKPKKDK